MKFENIAIADINGEQWEIGYGYTGVTNGKINDGLCTYKTRRITINRGCTCSLLSVLAHELLHARVPDLKEDTVDEYGELLSQVYDLFSQRTTGHGRGGSVV